MHVFSDDTEMKNETSVQIATGAQKELSRSQRLFNVLSQRIEKLENEIALEDEKLSALSEMYQNEVLPAEKQVANERIALAMSLGRAVGRESFSKRQLDKIRETIVVLCDVAFRVIMPNAAQEAFYDQWADVSYKDEMEALENESKEMFFDYVRVHYGVVVDRHTFDDSPEGFARFKAEMNAQYGHVRSNNSNKEQEKSKKQAAKENKQKTKEEHQNKSLRGIYIALVKLLHPDTETDPVLKAGKEEIMKKITVAYEQKDLTTLLKLEMEWVHKTSERLAELSGDKLKMYIATLKQQVAQLEREKADLYQQPQYSRFKQYAGSGLKASLQYLQLHKKIQKKIKDDLKLLADECNSPYAKKQIIEFTNYFTEANAEFDE